MIQDIYPHKLNNHYDPTAEVSGESIVLNIVSGRILINEAAFEKNVLEFPHYNMFPERTEVTYLFSIDEEKYFFLNKPLDEDFIPKGFAFIEDRALRKVGIGPDTNLFAAITGKHLADWYRDTCYCGRCGGKMIHHETERAMKCTSCGYVAYPRIMPAVIVGVTNGNRLLITRYNRGYAHNALVAGFTEIGETAEETVAREVMEEAGVKVKNIRYYKSQPWGSANDLLLGFFCDVDGDDTITMDDNELKYAKWTEREDIELQPGTFSLTNEMMKMFKDGLI